MGGTHAETIAPTMASPTPVQLRLQPHPATPCAAVDGLRVELRPLPHGGLCVVYQLTGALSGLVLPGPAPAPASAATDGLWRHTCLEAFIAPAQGTAYTEFNFSPSGDWARYAFNAERVRAPSSPPVPAPQIATGQNARTLTLTATLAADALPATADGAAALLGLSAVIEALDGSLSYWALAHPAATPDFHARAGWTARLPTIA